MQEHSHSVHRKILKDAWEITWRNKWLWFLGLFAAFWGDSGAYQFFTSSLQAIGQRGEISLSFWQQVQTLKESTTAAPSPVSIVIFTALIVVLGLIIWITTTSRGGLIFAIKESAENKKIGIQKALSQGTEKFWKIFGLSLLGKILCGLFLIGLVALVIRFSVEPKVINSLLYILGFVLFTALFLVVSFVVIYALAYAMIWNSRFYESIKNAVVLFAKNWLVSIELAVILFAISFLLGLVIIAVALILAVPFLLLLIILLLLNLPFVLWIVGLPILIILFLILLLVGAGFSVFQLTAWVLLFKRLTEGGTVAKLIRIFHPNRD